METTFLRDAINRLVDLGHPDVREIGGNTYASVHYERIDVPVDKPRIVTVDTLDGLVKLIKAEICHIPGIWYVRADTYNHVEVFTNWQAAGIHHYERFYLYEAKSDTPSIGGPWHSQEEMIVLLRSMFEPTADRDYLLELVSRISLADGVTTDDNGVTQKVTQQTGVVLKDTVQIKPIVHMIPYRTFLEIDQPDSDFLLRVNKDGFIGLFDADAGAWKLEAKRRIARYLSNALIDEREDYQVIVMI